MKKRRTQNMKSWGTRGSGLRTCKSLIIKGLIWTTPPGLNSLFYFFWSTPFGLYIYNNNSYLRLLVHEYLAPGVFMSMMGEIVTRKRHIEASLMLLAKKQDNCTKYANDRASFLEENRLNKWQLCLVCDYFVNQDEYIISK